MCLWLFVFVWGIRAGDYVVVCVCGRALRTRLYLRGCICICRSDYGCACTGGCDDACANTCLCVRGRVLRLRLQLYFVCACVHLVLYVLLHIIALVFVLPYVRACGCACGCA